MDYRCIYFWQTTVADKTEWKINRRADVMDMREIACSLIMERTPHTIAAFLAVTGAAEMIFQVHGRAISFLCVPYAAPQEIR